MLLVAHRLRQILMDQLAHLLPHWSVIHPEQVIAFGDELLADHVHGSIAADGAPLVEDLFDHAAVT